jgi:uncharacterized repeat protein (TIGR01451 family)
MSLVISSSAPAAGNIANSSLAIDIDFVVVPGTATTVDLPVTTELWNNDVIESLGIHVTSDVPVVVHGWNRRPATGGGYLVLPTAALGTSYIVSSWHIGLGGGSQFAIVGTEDGTTVTVTTTANGGSRTAGVPYVLSLDQGSSYLLVAGETSLDLTGTTIASDKPVAVFGGRSCAQVPAADGSGCDYSMEQILPTSAWGLHVLTVRLAPRTAPEVVRILASENGTEIRINGALITTINALEHFDTTLGGNSSIVTTHPVYVTQFAADDDIDNLPDQIGDPLMMTVLPTTAFQSSYRFSAETGGWAASHLNIVAPAAATGTVFVDGVLVPGASFSPIAASGYSAAQIPVTSGGHTVTAAAPIGVQVYGFAHLEGYGYPAGALLAPLSVNVAIQKSSSAALVEPNGPVQYTIVVTNSGTDAVNGATVTDVFPAGLSNVNWTCSASGGSSCTPAGAGNIDDLVTLLPGGSATYTVTATAPGVLGPVVNNASVTMPGNVADASADDDTASAGFSVVTSLEVPSLSIGGMVVLGLMLSLVGVVAIRR